MENTEENIRMEKCSFSHYKIYTDILIDATPEEVWSVLTDFDSYKDWSYLFLKLEGEFADGGKATVYFNRKPDNPNSTNLMIVDHTLTVKEGEFFSWSDVFLAGMRDHHVYKLEATKDGKTRFIQTDEVIGGIAWLLGGTLNKFYAKNYPKYNNALKMEVERRFGK